MVPHCAQTVVACFEIRHARCPHIESGHARSASSGILCASLFEKRWTPGSVKIYGRGNCRSRARFSRSTFTRGSPRNPKSGCSANCSINRLISSTGAPLSLCDASGLGLGRVGHFRLYAQPVYSLPIGVRISPCGCAVFHGARWDNSSRWEYRHTVADCSWLGSESGLISLSSG